MKQRHLLLVVAGFFFTNLLASDTSRKPTPGVYDFPLTFEENRGQADSRFDYVTRGPGYALYLSGEEVLFGVRQGSGSESQTGVVGMRLAGGLPDPAADALEPAITKSHYYLGNDPAQWLSSVPHFKRILYREVYPGVDLVFYGTPKHLEYDSVVSPGASWQQIRLQFEGAKDVSLSPDGQLVLKLQRGEFVQPPPVMYQETGDGTREPIEGSFVLAGDDEVAFRVGSYDHSRPLVIDPVIVLYLGYLGGSSFTDNPNDIATDSTGAVYVAGQTFSSDFPATITTWESSPQEAYVVKINPQGTAIVWAVVFGGLSDDQAFAVAVDTSQQVCFCGETESSDLPVSASPYQGSLEGSEDAWVAKLSSDGASLRYGSCLGGSTEPGFSFRNDSCNGIDVDTGLIYVGGVTNTSDFDTTVGAFDTTGPIGFSGSFVDDDDAFISVFDPSLSGAASLVYSTFLGSQAGSDVLYDLAVIAPGEVAVTGSTSEVVAGQPASLAPAGDPPLPFPTTVDAFQTSYQGPTNGSDMFVTRLDTGAIAAAALIYSTFFGSTTSFDEGHSIDVLGDDAFVLGTT